MTKRKASKISKATSRDGLSTLLENGSAGSRAEEILVSALRATLSAEKAGEKKSHEKEEKKRISAAKKWVFVWYNFDSIGSKIPGFIKNVEALCDMCQFQEEICPTTKKHHIQGFLIFKDKQRPVERFRHIDNTIHYETMRGSVETNIEYTHKDYTKAPGGFYYGYRLPRAVQKVEWTDLSEDNQNWLKPIMEEPYDYRTIHWICDYKGNWGKSRIQKYLVDNFNAIMVSGAGKDIAYAISQYKENKHRWPDYVLCNIPRSTDEKYISYGMLEQVKDGLVFSGKYESCQLRLPQVKMIVFANTKPIQDGWSVDRVKLTVIGEESFVF